MLARQALCSSYVTNHVGANHVTKLLARRRHHLVSRTVKHRVALVTARQYATHDHTMAAASPFDNMAVRRYTTHDHSSQSPFDNMGVRRFATKSLHENDVMPSQPLFDHKDVRRYTTITKQDDFVKSPSPFDNMAIRIYTTKSSKHLLSKMEDNSFLSPSPFDNMGVRRYSTLSAQLHDFILSPSPFDNMGVRRYSSVLSQEHDHILSPSPFENMGVRRYSTILTGSNSFVASQSPFDNMGVQRYSSGSARSNGFVTIPSPFDNMGVPRYSTQREHNVVSSPFADVVIPDMGVSQYVWNRVEEWSEKTAIVCGITDHGYTYRELRATCLRFASGLKRAGFEPGQVLAVILPNTPDYAVAMLGAIEAEMMVTTVNPVYVPNEIAKQLVDSNARVIVAFPEKYKEVVEAVRIAKERGYAQPMIIVTPSPDSSEIPDGALPIQHFLASDDVSNVSTSPVNCTSPVVIPYSSGTTGLPKGVCLSHRNLVSNIEQVQGDEILSITRPTTSTFQEVVPAVLPFYHIYGMNGILFSKLQAGVKIVTLPKFQSDTFLTTILKHKATILFLVPPLVLFMGSSNLVTPDHLADVTFVLSGAAPIGEKDVARFLKKAPPTVQFLQGYGLTETSPCVFTTVPYNQVKKLAAVGQVVPNTLAKVVNVETGEALGPGEVGEVCCKGPQNMLGYYNNPQATADMIDKDGWLHTGDLGYYDEDNDFFIVDRLKELIKVKGFQVAPAELEELLRSHPDVLDAAVIGIPDARTGEVPLGFIVPRPGAASGIEKTVMEFVASKVSSYKHLAAVKCIEIIPKSPAGKILRKILRDEYKNLDVKTTSGSC